jgi:hypothetical protein
VAQVILDEHREAGRYSLRLDASHLASGVYICRMVTTADRSAAQFSFARKIILMK